MKSSCSLMLGRGAEMVELGVSELPYREPSRPGRLALAYGC